MLQGKTLAVLGAGMMGGGLAQGLARTGTVPAGHIAVFDTLGDKARTLAGSLGDGARVAASPQDAADGADLVLLAVKPGIIPEALAALAPVLTPSQLVVSIAAGVRLATMEALLPASVPIIRAMPNTPSLVGEGATALCRGAHATDEHAALARALFDAVGITVNVDETLMDAVTGLSGSGPAYVYLIIEALADGGVQAGLPRAVARQLAAQTVQGAARMAGQTGEHTAQLKDNVTTPGGTTIAGLAVLERAGVRSALMDAVQAAAARSKELS